MSSNRVKVVFLFNGFRGEMEKQVHNQRDHDNHFFGLFRLARCGIDASYLELESLFPIRFARFLRRRVLSMHFLHAPLLLLLRKYDVVLTSGALGTLFLRSIFHIGPKKWIMYDYNLSGPLKNARSVKEKLFKWLMGTVDGFITLSPEEANEMRRMYPNKARAITFIPFGCDTKYFAPNPQKAEDKSLVISIGKDPGRDWKTLFSAVRGLSASIQLTLPVGRLNTLSAVPENVTSHTLNTSELHDLYARAGVVVLPLAPRYPNDTMGCSTLVEAMAMGKAIVATDTSTMRTYIKNGVNGMLVPQGNAKAMRDAIMQLLEDEELRSRLGREARTTACDMCDADVVAGELANFLKILALN